MAENADSVVVELIAQTDQFDAAARSSATNFSKSMSDIQSAGAGAEKGVSQFSSALKENRLEMNNSRVGMMEFQHIARGVSDQLAAGAPLTQVLGQHMAMLGEAVALSGGAFGKLGAFLGGPWGIALTLATTLAVGLISKHREQADSLDDVYDKLVKHKEQTALSAQAEDIWSHSLDGLIERETKLTEQLGKRLQTQTDVNRATMLSAQEDFAAASAAAAKIEADPKSTAKQLDDAEKAITKASIALHDAQVLAGQDAGAAAASISESAKVWADKQLSIIHAIQGTHPELAEGPVAEGMSAAYNQLKNAIDSAASANVNFNDTVTQTNTLNSELQSGTITVATYDQSIRSLAKSLNDMVASAKNAPKAIEDFKKAVIGAEGAGPNKAGSPAAGIGQFMPGTWEHYYAKAYGNPGNLSTTQIDALRDKSSVAAGVIDAAANDYAEKLKAAGVQVTAASLYAFHMLSAGTNGQVAIRLLKAPDDASARSIVGSRVVAQNGNIFTGTVGQAKAALAKRIGDSSGAVSSGAAAIQAQIEQTAKAQAASDKQFQQESDQLDAKILSARAQQLAGYDTQADLAEQKVRADQKTLDDKIKEDAKAKVAAGLDALTVGVQAAILHSKNKEAADAEVAAIEHDKYVKSLQQAGEAVDQEYRFRVETLQGAEQNATSQAQRRELDLAIIDIQFQQKEADLKRLQMTIESNKDFATSADLQAQDKLVKDQLGQLPAQKGAAIQGALNNTMDPLESWLHSIPHDADAVTEALQGIAVNGFDTIASSIAGVVTGTETLGQAFGNIAKSIINDLVQMTVKMLIFRALSSVLGGGSSLGGIGGLLTNSSGASVSSGYLGLDGFRAGGGPVSQGGAYVVGEHGPELFVPGQSGTIVPNNASAASPWAAATQGMVIVKVEANDYFDARVAQVSGPIAAQAGTRGAFGGAAMARDNLARRQLHQLGSRG